VLAELVDIKTYRLAGHRRRAGARCRHRPRRVTGPLAAAAGSYLRPGPAARAAAAEPVLAPTPVRARAVVPVAVSVTRLPGVPSGAPRVVAPSGAPRVVAPSRATLRWRRAVAVGMLAVVIGASWIGIRAALGGTGGGPLAATGAPGGVKAAAVRVWIVRPGDTLWSIAEAVDPNGDVRPLVDRLAGEARGTAIYPGETIAIPGR
jgi:nucleoid-associated protein YgaU